MKRLSLICAAIATLAATLPAGELAMARDNDRGGQQARGRGPPDRGAERRGPDRRAPQARGPERRGDDRRWDQGRGAERRLEAPGQGRRALREEYDRRDSGRRRFEDGPYAPPDARPARRGGYLPDSYRGGVVDDYQRLRLRPPPRGYAWVRVNGGYALVSVGDGRVFDVIPD
ncbi:RcnB family protein [uncultured Phenylobacterium sp.]|uniref:RcnB family protein n=1 Tax=uncultured Phenylobacterium sp. TaxID=349273 RepID=UPI0025D4A133|nr:RcnB family protein [uncultured Phenylobacterium sp.]